MALSAIGEVGGIFAVLVFIHFFADWLFQSHDEAMAKSTNSHVRARHCAIYTVAFLPFFWLAHVPLWQIGLFTVILFESHFIEDTYIPVVRWMKHIRKPPPFTDVTLFRVVEGYEKVQEDTGHAPQRAYNDKERFLKYLADSPALANILMITVDQIIHIFFLLVIAFMIVTLPR